MEQRACSTSSPSAREEACEERGTVPELLQNLAVDEELLQRSAASTLGEPLPCHAEARVRDFHYHLAIDQGRSERQRLSGKLSKFDNRKRRLQLNSRKQKAACQR